MLSAGCFELVFYEMPPHALDISNFGYISFILNLATQCVVLLPGAMPFRIRTRCPRVTWNDACHVVSTKLQVKPVLSLSLFLHCAVES
jgi:hypothetical protein